MRLDNYIVEQIEDLEEAAEKIKRDCAPFLKETKWFFHKRKPHKYGPLWRGTRSGGDTFISQRTSRKNRKPRNTPEEVSKDIDKKLEKRFGWRPRSEGVFTSSSRGDAFAYGIPTCFFPVGNYKYIWGIGIRDLFTMMPYKVIAYNDKRQSCLPFSNEPKDPEVHEKWEKEEVEPWLIGGEKYEEWWEESIAPKYTSINLKKAIKEGREVSFLCKKYYLINPERHPDIENLYLLL